MGHMVGGRDGDGRGGVRYARVVPDARGTRYGPGGSGGSGVGEGYGVRGVGYPCDHPPELWRPGATHGPPATPDREPLPAAVPRGALPKARLWGY